MYAYYATASSKLVCPADGRASSVKLTSGSNFWIERTGSRLRLERSESSKRKEEDRAGRINSIEQRSKENWFEASRLIAFRVSNVNRETRAGPLFNLSCYLHYRIEASETFAETDIESFSPSFFFFLTLNQRFVYIPVWNNSTNGSDVRFLLQVCLEIRECVGQLINDTFCGHCAKGNDGKGNEKLSQKFLETRTFLFTRYLQIFFSLFNV